MISHLISRIRSYWTSSLHRNSTEMFSIFRNRATSRRYSTCLSQLYYGPIANAYSQHRGNRAAPFILLCFFVLTVATTALRLSPNHSAAPPVCRGLFVYVASGLSRLRRSESTRKRFRGLPRLVESERAHQPIIHGRVGMSAGVRWRKYGFKGNADRLELEIQGLGGAAAARGAPGHTRGELMPYACQQEVLRHNEYQNA
jgi:hypothetical protein